MFFIIISRSFLYHSCSLQLCRVAVAAAGMSYRFFVCYLWLIKVV